MTNFLKEINMFDMHFMYPPSYFPACIFSLLLIFLIYGVCRDITATSKIGIFSNRTSVSEEPWIKEALTVIISTLTFLTFLEPVEK